jgi:Tol biopolymer transport system component
MVTRIDQESGDFQLGDFLVRPQLNRISSPDGNRLAFDQRGDGFDFWIDELSDGTLRRLTFGYSNFSPVWTSDGKWVAFGSNAHGGPLNIYLKIVLNWFSELPRRLP